MVKLEELFMIRDLKSKGLSIRQIAEQLDLDPKTVRKWLKSDQLPKYQRKRKTESKLEPHKDYILERMMEGCLNAVVIYDEIKEKGYTGKISILREFMHPYRKHHKGAASIRFETPPGKQAQVDWGEFHAILPDGSKKKLHAFVMIMGYSRQKYAEYTEDEKLETLIGCHERAFKFFGGTAETILYDNMKTVVQYSHKSGNDKWNQTFLRFADYHGFTPIRCRPYNPRGKGKVENGVKYLRRNFWPRVKEFRNIAELNQKTREWLDTKCNVRLHKTTRRIPAEAFLEEKLISVNETSFLSASLASRKVMNDCMVQYETNLYSVPFQFVGRRVAIKDLKNGYIEFYDENGLYIDTHEKVAGKHQFRRKKKHFEGIISRNRSVKAPMAPRMTSDSSPKVYQRPLDFYDRLITEVTE